VHERWLIIGHGSVGGSLVKRLQARGGAPWVYDPKPRVAVPEADGAVRVTRGPVEGVDYVATCVPPAASAAAAQFVRDNVPGKPPVFDWTSALPATKREAASTVLGSWVDIALLDSLDKDDELALLAISGPEAAELKNTLERLAFEVVVVGPEVGQAAQTKLVRSLFMKGLEALLMEARSIATQLDASGTTWKSIERNLGRTFASFADLLVVTDATHAARRGAEIKEAVEFVRDQGFEPVIAAAAGEALSRLGDLWSSVGPEVTSSGPGPVLLRAVDAFSDGRRTAVSSQTQPRP
jgi:3-hydroxyisobutyrate dehydrogenase-like beta-hydroxyacid dehydrogenase